VPRRVLLHPLLLLIAFAASSCIRHQARVENPAGPGHADDILSVGARVHADHDRERAEKDATDIRHGPEGMHSMGKHERPPSSETSTISNDVVARSGPFPQDIVATGWNRSGENEVLHRWDGRCQTPLPWWQRFPFDLATDLAPTTFTSERTVTIVCHDLPRTDPERLATEARAAGYAAPAAPAANPGAAR
jgi:hypothetical protein